MTHSNEPNLPDDRRPQRQGPQSSDDDLVLPSMPRASYNRILVDAYYRGCRRGFNERYKLITELSQMSYEDRAELQRMEINFRELLANKLRELGFAHKASELSVRVLHPVVSVGQARREYHLYVDVVGENGRCWFVDFDAAQQLEAGPASIHLSCVGMSERKAKIIFSRLFSIPAFNEAMGKLVSSSFEDVCLQPRSFLAFGWIMQGIAMARVRAASEMGIQQAAAAGPFSLDKVKSFQWTGEKRPFEFECIVENAYYIAQITLDPKRRQPCVVLYEEGI